MKRIQAFFLALILFVLTATIGHVYTKNRVKVDNTAFSTWTEEKKSLSLAGITENLNEESMPVFGSSEFQHGLDTIYHPASVFSATRFNPMLIGAGYYQSLSHAVTLAAIEPYMTTRKAVLILSPQWFRKAGVVDQAYASRFSETIYAAMLCNEKLSSETKDYIISRTEKLLAVDTKTLENVKLHEKVMLGETASPLENFQEYLWKLFLEEKDIFSISASEAAAGIRQGDGLPKEEVEPDWDALMQQAEEDGEKENTNELYIDDDSYKKLEPYLPLKKGMNSDAVKGYQTGPEFDDLRCFLQTCQELDIEPMLVMLPVNGYYYDYTEFPVSARQAYYEKIREIAAEYGAELTDLSDQEYTKYFFEDRVHIGKKGWVTVDEAIYSFYYED